MLVKPRFKKKRGWRKNIRNDVPENLKGKTLYSLEVGNLDKNRGEFEERLKAVLKEVKDAEGRVFIDEIKSDLRAGKTEGSMDAKILKPMLARGELHCIQRNGLDEYRQNWKKQTRNSSKELWLMNQMLKTLFLSTWFKRTL